MLARDLSPFLRRLLLGLSAIALLVLLASELSWGGAERARSLGLALLLGAPWAIVLTVLIAAARERAWRWVGVTAALLGVAALSLL